MKTRKKKQNNMFKAAEYYLSLGWSVIPVKADKMPLVNWKEYQNTKPTKEELVEWFSNKSTTGLAIITGKISGLIVLDFEKGQKVPHLPITPTVATGGGGKHFYFALPEDINIRSSARPLGKDYLMDVRAEGGYVIAPPSLHRSGQYYKWENSIVKHSLAKLPDFYKVQLQNQSGSKVDFQDIVNGVEQGARHDMAVRLTGLLLNKFDREQWTIFAWPMLKGWNLQNKPPLDGKELQQIFLDIARKETEKRKEPLNGEHGVVSLSELMAEVDTEEDWLVDHIIPNGGITILSGQAGNFKTWITLHLALCVASGEKLFGHFSTTKSSVLIVDEENQKRTLRRRLKLLGYEDSLNIHFLVQSGFKIDREADMKKLIAIVKEKDIKLVIFDSFVRVHSKEENVAKEIAELFAIVKQLTRIEVTVLFTHHHRKQTGPVNAQSLRGSSDILAAVDAQLSVQKNDNGLLIQQNKLRDAEELKPFTITVDSTKDSLSLIYQGETVLGKKNEAKSLIIETLLTGSKLQTEIVEKLKSKDIGKNKVGEALHELVAEGRIVETSGPHNTKQYDLPLEAEDF